MNPKNRTMPAGGSYLPRRAFNFSLAFLFILLTLQQALSAPATQTLETLAGKLLVATPEIRDPRFAETVIYIVHHDKDGAMGLVINQPLGQGPISELLKSLGINDENPTGQITVYYGGPVARKKAFILHTDDYVGKGTTRLTAGLAVTVDPGVVRAIAGGKGPQHSLFIMGHAGWGPGQLEREIAANAWFSIAAEKSLLFEGDPATKWKRGTDRRKVKT